ncbi:hypothetical protein NQZ68_012110 [Dissostichus eleginoides]|nr:hypothetical protein NQZ68_012110 [Dissostichus eleginoides]
MYNIISRLYEVERMVVDASVTESCSTCDAEHRRMACLQLRRFRERQRSVLYAGRISLIEVSA